MDAEGTPLGSGVKYKSGKAQPKIALEEERVAKRREKQDREKEERRKLALKLLADEVPHK